MHRYTENIIRTQNNVFTADNALHVINTVWNLPPNLIEKADDGKYFISDEKLYGFLTHHSSMSVKSIFFLSTRLILSDRKREPICKIEWTDKPIKKYIRSLYVPNYEPTAVQGLTSATATEDIVTFCSAELYKKLNFGLLAVSYPGAQGDRCVLKGGGRNVLRSYVDIIARGTDESGVTVYLEECKADISNSRDDAEKLNRFISDPVKRRGLEKLFHKLTNIENGFDISIGIGAKVSDTVPTMKVDYIFEFDIDNSVADKTIIKYYINVIDTKLIGRFSPLMNDNGRLEGELSYPKIYVIK